MSVLAGNPDIAISYTSSIGEAVNTVLSLYRVLDTIYNTVLFQSLCVHTIVYQERKVQQYPLLQDMNAYWKYILI
jgi:hypothetical protein